MHELQGNAVVAVVEVYMGFFLQPNDTLQNYSLRKKKSMYYLVKEIRKTILLQFPKILETLALFRH